MNTPKVSDHVSEIALLGIIAVGVLAVMCFGLTQATEQRTFDPSAYLVVLTLIVGAIKERWTQRSVDRMGDQLGQSAPLGETPQPAEVVNATGNPVPTKDAVPGVYRP